MNKPLILLALMLISASFANAKDKDRKPVESTLHLMEPQYGFHYGVPQRDSVKATIGRVLGFLEEAMPLGTENGRLKTGGLRMTSYEAGVLYAACEDASRRTGDDRYVAFTRSRLQLFAELAPTLYDSIRANRNYDRQIRPMLFPGALDDAGAMCAAYMRLCLMDSKGKPTDLSHSAMHAVIKTYMNRIWKQYRIGDDKIFARERPYHNSVWLDDMYMGIPSLAWYGALTANAGSLHDAVNQIRAFKARMWVSNLKLFRHGWVESMEPHPVFPWGRANGWAILSMCEVMDAINAYEKAADNGLARKEDFTKDKEFVLDLLRQHIEGLCHLQDKTGMWHQLLNNTSSYLETSATAIYAYCLAHAICEGWISALTYGPQTLLAWNAVSTQVNSKGQVENTCVGTGMGFDPAFYCYRPVHVMAAHGYGPVIWAGGEIIRLLDTTKPKMHDSAVLFYQ